MVIKFRTIFYALLIISVLCVIILLLYFGNCYHLTVDNKLLVTSNVRQHVPSLYYVIETSSCKIVNITVSSEYQNKYFTRPESISCTVHENDVLSINEPLVQSNLTHLFVNFSQFNGDINLVHSNCCYQEFYRLEPKPSQSDNQFRFDDACTSFNDTVNVSGREFIRVTCSLFLERRNSTKSSNWTINHKDFQSFVPKSKFLNRKIKSDNETGKYNILMIGIDAVSRLNFIRQMPKTYKYLLNKLEAIEMNGYNKIGDNTFPNLMAVLSGLTVDQMRSTCWKSDDEVFDQCPFIWNEYQKRGYVTAFAEDASNIGLFQYGKNGFKTSPTDFYWTTMNHVSNEQSGFHKQFNSNLCLGTRLSYQVLWNYLLRFVETSKLISLSNVPFFALFWLTSITHDYVNYPQLIDDDFLTLLKNLKNLHTFENSIVVVLSDHGIRWGEYRSTFNGFLEERLPFLYFIVPKSFPTHLKSILEENSNRLTTPFDLYHTFKDILSLNSNLNGFENGQSLFKIVPENRTCASAHINDHWCTCQTLDPISVHDNITSNLSYSMINELNSYLKNSTLCAQLSLDKVISVMKKTQQISQKEKLTYLYNDYLISLSALPSLAIFEATFRHYLLNNTYQLVGSIGRLNMYGTQSNCVENYTLKLYCFCVIN